MLALDLLLAALGLPVLACATYLLVLSVVATRPTPPEDDERPETLRFDIVVPAHDEEAGIAATVESLRALDYPPALRRILVVADNCADATKERAEAAGAIVMTRLDRARRGKGYALAHAFARIEEDAQADVVVVVDADTTVSPNLLRAFARRFEAGAHAVQASYGVRNPESSWRTRLMVIALALFHVLRSLGRERLGLSAGLRGNGMGLSREVLRRVPYDAFSTVEDVEYGLRLGEAGHRVHHVPEAHVWGEMVARERASRSQRRRWEQGRRALARTYAPRLLSAGFRRRDPILVDLAVDLLVPPLASLVAITLAGAGAALGWRALGGPLWPAIPWLASAAFVAVYVVRGWALSGAGARGLVDLLVFAPAYVVWKIALSLGRAGHRRGEWVRTEREVRHGS
jgi:cellulose synthase/poly-beta-1,6-N-acetylglucosamine synthase-like glycosyltransferase